MTTDGHIKRFQRDTLRRVMMVSLTAIIGILTVLSSTLHSSAGGARVGTLTIPTFTPTSQEAQLVEWEASFTIGDIGQFAHPPSMEVQRVQPDGTVVILDEGFEGAWPPPGWAAQPNWGASTCRALAGSKSAWVEGSADLDCGGNYHNDENAFLIYGPFSLADATAASLGFKLWLNSEYGYDHLCRMVSVDGASFGGICTSETTSGEWIDRTLDLTGWAGEPAMWIALIWSTDSSVVKVGGAFVDEVLVTKTMGGPTATPTATSTPTRTPTATPTPLPTPAWWWRIEKVFDWASGESTSIALGNTGHPYISFCDARILKLARWDGSAWQVETVDGASFVGEYSSLALDDTDRPHVAYYDDFTNDDLKYAHWDGSTWQGETVDSEGDVGKHASLALDGGGYPHISYYDDSNDNLKYAYQDASGWYIETVDSEGRVGQYTSLALDGSGYAHISYYDDTNDDLKYAYQDAAGWHTETVDSEGHVGKYTSLALDGSGYAHISYYDDTNDDLKYAYQDAIGWYTETVDSAGDVGQYTSLALDADGRPQISYYGPIDWSQGELKYARRDGSAWHIELVESGDVGKGSSLALNAAGRPRISYYDDANNDLKFALWLDAPPTPTPTPVTPTPVVPPGQAQGYSPELAPAATEGVIVVWHDDRFGSSYRDDVFGRRFDPNCNAVWPADVRVSTGPGTSYERYPAIATDADGNSLVVWYSSGDIYAQKLDQDGNHLWSADTLAYGWPSNGRTPRVGLDQHGNWYVMWRKYWDDCNYRGSCSQIYVSKFGPGAWSENVRGVPGYIYAHAYWPDIAVDPDGNSHLVWQEGRTDRDSNIYGTSLDADGNRRWPNLVRINSDTGSVPQAYPRVAVSAASDTYFVWADKRNDDWDIYAQKFDVNVGHRLWMHDIRVNSDTTTADQSEPDLVVDADGYIYVVWVDERNDVADIYAQKLTPDGTRVWPQDLRINATSQAETRSQPAITVDSTGVLYVAWESQWAGQHDIFMQSYTGDGARRCAVDVPVEGSLAWKLYLPLIERNASTQ